MVGSREVQEEDSRVVQCGRQKGRGQSNSRWGSHPGSCRQKQALVMSRNLIRAALPSLVPNSEDKERSGTTGIR
jgi:hypothetical protein